jgi:phytoene dehydrogenase-like protein
MTTYKERDVIVIGGGIAGLSAAILLARAGLRVRVCERAMAIGGRARTVERQGFQFEFGVHALHRAGPGIALLRELGISPRGTMPHFDRALMVDHDQIHRMPATISATLTTGVMGLRSKLRMLSWFSSLRHPATPERISELASMSVNEWIEHELEDRALQRVLVAMIGLSTYCREPERLSADAAHEQMRLAKSGVLYLDGGFGQLVAELEDVARGRGVEMEMGGNVEAIARRGDRWHVSSVGGEQEATQLLLAVTSTAAAKLLRSAGVEPTWAPPQPQQAACLDLGLVGPWNEPDMVVDVDEPTFMTVQSNYAERAPRGHTLVSAIWYRRQADEACEPAELRARLEAAIDRWIPDRAERTVQQQYLPDMTVTGDLPRPEQGGLAGRANIEPDPQRAPGLWLAGDWVGDRGMLGDAALASAGAAARSIIARQREAFRRSA